MKALFLDLFYTIFILVHWCWHVLFTGWYHYIFYPEIHVANDWDELDKILGNVYHRDVSLIIGRISVVTKDPFPITYTKRQHPLLLLTIHYVENNTERYTISGSTIKHITKT